MDSPRSCAAWHPCNEALLRRRDELQSQIDAWHRAHPGADFDAPSYRAYLREIGYVRPSPAPFEIDTAGVDPEIAHIAGPQLVVPVNNARYALNAANARWGSLYDALYGTDVISGVGAEAKGAQYNPRRGALVIDYVRGFLDDHFPLRSGSHREAQGYRIGAAGLEILLPDGSTSALRADAAFVGYRGEAEAPSTLLLVHHGLHVEIHVDRTHPIGRNDAAGISDVVLESAIIDDPGLRGFGRRGRHRGKSRRVSQLARTHDGRARRRASTRADGNSCAASIPTGAIARPRAAK